MTLDHGALAQLKPRISEYLGFSGFWVAGLTWPCFAESLHSGPRQMGPHGGVLGQRNQIRASWGN